MTYLYKRYNSRYEKSNTEAGGGTDIWSSIDRDEGLLGSSKNFGEARESQPPGVPAANALAGSVLVVGGL